MDDPTTYLNHLPFFPPDPFSATPRRAIVSISYQWWQSVQLVMKGCRKYRRPPLPQSSGIRSHLVLFQCFAFLHLITLSLSMREGFVKFPDLFFFFVSGFILCFHICKTTQLSLYTLTRSTSPLTFLPPNYLVLQGCIPHTPLSPASSIMSANICLFTGTLLYVY